MRVLLRRFAVALTVILALTFLLTGSSLVAARAKQALTGEPPVLVRLDVKAWRLYRQNTSFDEPLPDDAGTGDGPRVQRRSETGQPFRSVSV